ncbi:uncharacterized protein [Amphiura filiformis]|uniref:uncharacterized protein n=1 Tax=Amphiura filiformis TaxID=82378 RepID=UPI003B20FD7C
MDFNPSKCEVITISNKRNCISFPYTIHNETLKKTDCAKYLGVNITSNLSWSTHVDKICKKANSTQAFLQRNIRSCPQKIKARCYTTLVRPLLEFSSAAWAPHHKSDINKLESVQRRVARFVMRDYHRTSSVSNMLRQLNWPTLQQRRDTPKLVMLYKSYYGLVDIPPCHLVLLS